MLPLEEAERKIREISLYYLHNFSYKSRITAKGKGGKYGLTQQSQKFSFERLIKRMNS